MLRKTLTGISIGLLIASMAGCNGSSSRESNGEDPTSRDSATALTSVTESNFTYASWVQKDSASGTVYDPAIGKETPYVGSGTCIGCHEDFSWSSEKVAGFLEGKHVIHSSNINQEEAIAEGCSVCHDPIGEGPQLESLIANVPDGGLAAVGCENCHGPGGDHYGIGPIPNPTPDNTACAKCHDALPEGNHLTYHPEANNIGTNYFSSRHKTGSIRNEPICAKCHTDEGGKFYRHVTTRAQLNASVMPVEGTGSSVQCRTCHDSHKVTEEIDNETKRVLLLAEMEQGRGDDPYPSQDLSREYATCTACHQGDNAGVFDEDSNKNLTTETAARDRGLLEELIYHNDAHMRVITDTHYDNPATSYQSSQLDPTDPDYAPSIIEGYVVDRGEKNMRSCLVCHDVHSVQEIRLDRNTSTINDQWARSAHGGFLILAKEEARAAAAEDRSAQQTQDMKEAGATENEADVAWAPAWVHYDWDAQNRQGCQRCHTATGLKNYLTSPTDYDPANNDYSHLEGWKNDSGTITSSGQNEMLYCWGCHANNSGAIRDPGAITEIYEGTAAAPLVTVEYPDVEASNVCMSCHLGRETGAVVKTKTGFNNLGFVNSHYLAAGGSIFGQTGYTFGTRDYSIPASDTHVMLGRGTTGNAVVDANYTNGPCVTCHFGSNDGSHLLRPFTEYADTDVALNPVCVNCHTTRGEGSNAAIDWFGTDYELTDLVAGVLAPHKGRYLAALEALNQQLIVKGFVFTTGYPYFANRNWLSPGDTDTTGNVTGKNNMGAAFNYNLLIHEPGGVAHNRRYTRRLIYDSIDWLDNGVLDYSTGATLIALPDTTTYKASALSYLVNRGDLDINVGTSLERY